MSNKNNNKNKSVTTVGDLIVDTYETSSLTLNVDTGISSTDTTSDITWSGTGAYLYNTGDTTVQFTYTDPDENLRKEYPALQEAWEQYQLVKKLVEDQECDKYFEEKYKGFKEE